MVCSPIEGWYEEKKLGLDSDVFIANPIHGTAAWITESAFSLYLYAGGFGFGKIGSLLLGYK